MTARVIRKLTRNDALEAGRVVADALMVEPGYAAIMPDEDIRRRVMTTLMTASIRDSHHHGTILGAFVNDKVLGVAIWSPPGTTMPAEAIDTGERQDIPPALADIDPDIFRKLAEYDDACARHLPPEPFWYLPALAVDPVGQGKGIGSALLTASFELIGGHAAYLETGTPRNVRFYERFGFKVREAGVQLAPGSTPHWTMIRPARNL